MPVRQPGPWDVAFDRTFGFVFTNFSRLTFAWESDNVTFVGNVSGIENINRTCPIIIYQTQETPSSKMLYFVRGCAQVPQLGLVGEVNGTLNGVSILTVN